MKTTTPELRIEQCIYPDNPRDFYEPYTKMFCFVERYSIGDKHSYKHWEFSGWDDFKNHLIKEHDARVILPMYMYEHSGIALSTTPFNCRWDSGQIGFIFASAKDIRENFGVKKITKAIEQKVIEQIEFEVKEYDAYVSGDVWDIELFLDDDEIGMGICTLYGFDELQKEIEVYKNQIPNLIVVE